LRRTGFTGKAGAGPFFAPPEKKELTMSATRRMFALLVVPTCLLALLAGACTDSAPKDKFPAEGKSAESGAALPGPYPGVPAELGGAGFEDVAAELGFQTYVYTEDDLQYMGDPRATKGGRIIMNVGRYPVTIRTVGQYANYVENRFIETSCYEALLDLHPVTLEFVPRLASHWKISDDKMTFWFRIDPEARWSDGRRVVAEDVLATWKLLMDETILEPSSQLVYGKFEPPVAESMYIVRIKAKQLNWRNLLYFGSSMTILPAHVIGDLTGAKYLKQFQWKTIPGSGPYTVRESDIKKQQSYALRRRDNWWAEQRPENRYLYNFDRIEFRVVKDNDRLMFEKLKAGETDFYVVSRAQWWAEETDFDEIKKGWIQKRRIYNSNPAGTFGIFFNMRKEPFDDIRVRQAFAHLINRQMMIEELFYNQYFHTDSLYSGSVYENPDNPKYRYDPEKAIELLAEAGWTEKNSQGILVKDGRPFVVELGITKESGRIITPYQQELRRAGIDLKLKFQDSNSLFKVAQERKFELYLASYGGLIFPNPETSLKSSLADQHDNNNLSGFKNERVDELLDLYDEEFSQARRIEMIREIDKIYMDTCPQVLFWYAPYHRFLYWDKFGYPEYYISMYGDYRSVFSYWWYDEDKAQALEEARKQGTTLPVGETEVKFWPEYLQEHDLTKTDTSPPPSED
jgi:microcin C transport system substrate-binding protein